MNRERKSIIKIKKMIEKNRHNISRIVVSEEFMLQLNNHADLIEMEEKRLRMKSEHSFNGVDNSSEDYMDFTYLWGVQIYLSDHIIHGAVLEMLDGEFFVLKNI
jgi:hypothetical protein